MYFIKVYYMISKVISDFSNANWHHDIFKYGIYISYILFFIAFTGVGGRWLS